MRIALALVSLCLAAAPLGALTVVPATFEELVRESVSVVHGRVREVHGRWSADRRTIVSTVTLEVYDAFKGSDAGTATFVVPGGEAGGRRLVLPGAPVFRTGDEVIVFLRGDAPALPQPVGLSLGVYRVAHRGPAGGAVVVPSPVHTAAGARIVRGSAATRVRTLEAFAADVRASGAAR